ncbi:hypothetical protein Plhal304r1_c025g0086221 [Plasmopara halstedii]
MGLSRIQTGQVYRFTGPEAAADNADEEDDLPVLSDPAQDENDGGSQPDDMVGEEDENSVALTSKKALELLEKDGLLPGRPRQL